MGTYLFIDDDQSFLRTNRIYFERRGNRVLTAQSYAEGEALLRENRVDCIILDILMPGTDGWAACRALRDEGAPPVIFLTGLTEQECLYRGFSLGAADYMTKPYDFRELELRIHARIRSRDDPLTKPGRKLSYPPLEIDPEGRSAAVNGSPLHLTAYEFDILLFLARDPGKVYPLEEIYRLVWRRPDLGNTLTVRSHLARMRHKLEEACPERQFIGMAWGRGFYFCPNEKEEAPKN
ncbi:MAG: response regulator transcription factor [Oscillospiraceae bacterium]